MQDSSQVIERITPRWVGPEEAERLSAASDRYFEYAHGILYAIAGGTPEHGAVLAAVFAAIASHVGRGPCRTLEGWDTAYENIPFY